MRSRFVLNGSAQGLRIRDDGTSPLPARALQKLNDGLNLGEHAARREMPLVRITFQLLSRYPAQSPLVRSAEIDADLRDPRGNDQQVDLQTRDQERVPCPHW